MSNKCHTTIRFTCTGFDFIKVFDSIFFVTDDNYIIFDNDKLNNSKITNKPINYLKNDEFYYVGILEPYNQGYVLNELHARIDDDKLKIYYNGSNSNKEYYIETDTLYEFEVYYNTRDYYPNFLLPIAMAKLIDIDFDFIYSADTEEGTNHWFIKHHELQGYVSEESNDVIPVSDSWDYWVKMGFVRREEDEIVRLQKEIRKYIRTLSLEQRTAFAKELKKNNLPVNINSASYDELKEISRILPEGDEFDLGL